MKWLDRLDNCLAGENHDEKCVILIIGLMAVVVILTAIFIHLT